MNNSMILGLTAQTWIHAGSGEKDGIVDLPIQREAHNGWPVIFGSSLKGAMRSAATLNNRDSILTTLFGPESFSDGTSTEQIHAGALMISDARLLWLPVRSLTTHTRYVTCPAMLRRFYNDLCRSGLISTTLAVPIVEALDAIVVTANGNTHLYLEEYAFTLKTNPGLIRWCELLAQFSEFEAIQIEQQLVLVNDDQFAHLCQAAIPLHPHIALDYATKSVKAGALWYEEALPPETQFYSLLIATDARDKSGLKAANILLQAEQRLFGERPYLQVGGNESTGMGWFKIACVREIK